MSNGAEFALYAIMLVLPLSALLSRRVPLARTAKMALVWIAIFGLGLIIVGQRHRLLPIWENARDALFGHNKHVVGATAHIATAAAPSLNCILHNIYYRSIIKRTV